VSAEAPKAKIEDKDTEVSVTVSKKKSKTKVDKISAVVTTLLNRENDVSKGDVSPNRVNTEAGSPVVTEWWGSKYGFVRGGKLGSKLHDGDSSINEDAPDRAADKTTLNARTAFCEQDQESLYKLVQDKATAGKRGLGIGDCTRKLGGAHFKGQKTIFGDDGESDGNEEQKDQESSLDQSTDSENLQAGSEDKICRKKQKIGDGIKKGGVKQEGGSKVKLKDLIAHFLSEAPEQGMKLKRLKKQVIATTGLILDSEGDQRDAFKEKVNLSSESELILVS
jgi:Pin2-interacting protein X1